MRRLLPLGAPALSRTRIPSAARRRFPNRPLRRDAPVHRWYRFVLSFPPDLVRRYLADFQLGPGARLLDPFCGTGTTLVECRKLGIGALGLEPAPMARFASTVKLDWQPDPDRLLTTATKLADRAASEIRRTLASGPRRRLPDATGRLLIKNSISPIPLHRVLILRDHLSGAPAPYAVSHLRLALAAALVRDIGNLRFGPEVGVGRKKADAPVVSGWLARVGEICDDLRTLDDRRAPPAVVLPADARRDPTEIESHSVDAIITSPPYPNEKDYTRTTRLETVLLGFASSQPELRTIKKTLLRSNTRGVYKHDGDAAWVEDRPEVQRLAAKIERRRQALGKTSGFERMYSRVTRLYFGGMTRHLASMRRVLKPGAMLAYVVGDQASYLRVMIRTGQLLAGIAESLGYEHVRTDLFRTRPATATRQQLREEVLVLRRP